LFRPVMAEPPLCTLAELATVLTIDHVADLHEVLDLKEAARNEAKENSGNDNRRTGLSTRI
jgi:hypothetical protein